MQLARTLTTSPYRDSRVKQPAARTHARTHARTPPPPPPPTTTLLLLCMWRVKQPTYTDGICGQGNFSAGGDRKKTIGQILAERPPLRAPMSVAPRFARLPDRRRGQIFRFGANFSAGGDRKKTIGQILAERPPLRAPMSVAPRFARLPDRRSG